MSMTRRTLEIPAAVVFALAMLAGCDRPAPAPASTSTPSPPAAPSPTTTPVSIIRDDIDVTREPVPLAPLTATIGFPEGGAALSQAAIAKLQGLLDSPQIAGGGAITLRGHSDSTGDDAANLRVSKKRAEAVRDWLVGKGVAAARVTVIAMGEQNPAQPNALPDGRPNEAGRAANRRVALTVAVPAGTPAAAPSGETETLVDQVTQQAH
jgi:OOP family OmpA-OmpF porin